jgi:ADP-heptose:LPS heptosyltransferase
MFFAKVLGVPTIVLFGPSDPKQVVESSPDIVPIFTPTWPCQPCSNARCHQKETYCMQSIDPLTVAKELAKRLPLSQFHD